MPTYRFCYSVRGVSKFLSHLDLLKLFSRALMRAGLPTVYSEGFNPHPKITFGPPRGVGIEGLAEWGDLQLKAELPSAEVAARLNEALPQGVRVLSARLLADTPHPALMAVINLAAYSASLPADSQLLGELAAGIQKFTEADAWEITRVHPKKGPKQIDLKSGVSVLSLAGNNLLLEIPFREGGSVKPAEVLKAVMPAGMDYRLARTGLYIVDESGLRREP